jgi:hypothetical protein
LKALSFIAAWQAESAHDAWVVRPGCAWGLKRACVALNNGSAPSMAAFTFDDRLAINDTVSYQAYAGALQSI